MTDNLTPLGDRLLLRAIPEDKLAQRYGKLWLPPSGEDWQRYRRWEIAAVGPDVLDETLLPGLEVIVGKNSTPLERHGAVLMFVREADVLAILL